MPSSRVFDVSIRVSKYILVLSVFFFIGAHVLFSYSVSYLPDSCSSFTNFRNVSTYSRTRFFQKIQVRHRRQLRIISRRVLRIRQGMFARSTIPTTLFVQAIQSAWNIAPCMKQFPDFGDVWRINAVLSIDPMRIGMFAKMGSAIQIEVVENVDIRRYACGVWPTVNLEALSDKLLLCHVHFPLRPHIFYQLGNIAWYCIIALRGMVGKLVRLVVDCCSSIPFYRFKDVEFQFFQHLLFQLQFCEV